MEFVLVVGDNGQSGMGTCFLRVLFKWKHKCGEIGYGKTDSSLNP